MRTKNFLEETRKALEYKSKTPEDIVFIGSLVSGHECTWAEFEKLANFGYRNGEIFNKIARDLTITFSDGSKLVRTMVDDKDYWKYVKPVIRNNKKPITSLRATQNRFGWRSLEEIHIPD